MTTAFSSAMTLEAFCAQQGVSVSSLRLIKYVPKTGNYAGQVRYFFLSDENTNVALNICKDIDVINEDLYNADSQEKLSTADMRVSLNNENHCYFLHRNYFSGRKSILDCLA